MGLEVVPKLTFPTFLDTHTHTNYFDSNICVILSVNIAIKAPCAACFTGTCFWFKSLSPTVPASLGKRGQIMWNTQDCSSKLNVWKRETASDVMCEYIAQGIVVQKATKWWIFCVFIFIHSHVMFVQSVVLSQSSWRKKERWEEEDVTINNIMLQRPNWEANTGSWIVNRTQTQGRLNGLTFPETCNIRKMHI
jgi:hypothetical protein